MAKPVAIKVEGVYKDFKLPNEKNSTLKSTALNLFRRGGGAFQVQHALKDISFDVEEGEFFGIVGRNGSGKSTLLKILAGIYLPTRGRSSVAGKLVPFIELGVGFNQELTGRENVYLNGALMGFATKEIDHMYNDIVDFAELSDFMDQKLKNYSSGMQVRLAFSMATRAKADVLLVDEVLAVGDADFQRKCFNYFRSLKKAGTTVVFVTHDMSAVREYCDRAILIDKNEIIAEGSADDVAIKYTRLFVHSGESSVSVDSSRWGTGEVKFDDVIVTQNDGNIQINLTATAYSNLSSPVFGFTVKAAAGEAILGTNSKIRRRKLGNLKTGDKVKLTWEFPNILSDGSFTISPAVAHADGITISDWWDDATNFTVYKDEHVPYNVMPEIELEFDVTSR